MTRTYTHTKEYEEKKRAWKRVWEFDEITCIELNDRLREFYKKYDKVKYAQMRGG